MSVPTLVERAVALVDSCVLTTTRADHENQAILRVTIALSVQYTLIERREISDLKNSLYKAAKVTRDVRSIENVLMIVRALMSSVSDFKRGFATGSLYRSGRHKYVLAEIELFERGTGELRVAPTITGEHVTRAHPFSPGGPTMT